MDLVKDVISEACTQHEKGHLRWGQALMNALYTIDAQLYAEVAGTPVDVFYTQDGLHIDEFFVYLEEKDV